MSIDLNPQLSITKKLEKLCDDGRVAREAQQPPRSYLGASILGKPCKRSLQYGYYQAEPDNGPLFSGNTLRIFDVGHAIEALAIQWLQDAGFDLRTTDRFGKQFRFSVLDGMVAGHMDGVFLGGPDLIKYPALWECKSANTKRWKEFAGGKVAKVSIEYYSQVQLYMTYFQLTENPAVFMVVNKDTSALHFELIPYNMDFAQIVSDRAVEIVQAIRHGEALGRIAKSPDHFSCKWCAWKERCWKGGGNQ